MYYLFDTEGVLIHELENLDKVSDKVKSSKPTIAKYIKRKQVINGFYISNENKLRIRHMRIDPVYIYNYEGNIMAVATTMQTLLLRTTNPHQRESLRSFPSSSLEYIMFGDYRYYKYIPSYVANLNRRFSVYDKDGYLLGEYRDKNGVTDNHGYSKQLIGYHLKVGTGLIVDNYKEEVLYGETESEDL